MDGKMYFSGFDRQGNPLLNIGPNQLSNDATRYTKFLIFWLENAHHMNRSNQQQQQQQQQMRHPHQKLTLLADLAKVSMFSVMSPTVYVKLLDIISSHYPETLHMLLIVNPSWYLHVLWKLVSPFVDPVTRAKVYFVDTLQKKQQQQQQQQGERPGDNEEMAGTGGWVNGLHEFIASDQLNSRLGGSHDFEYHHASYWSQLLTVLGK
ncbi:CRAL-TRIO domain-containing protein [Obelidium mucronatum]|nr:CRAL-TRIO domain-containing protein [Obelidium mucronatum]